jgi:Bacterial TSP3 repeat
MISRKFPALFATFIAYAVTTLATPPAWWSDPNTAILDPSAPAHDYSPVNLGQLKHVATQANAYLDAILVYGGGSGEDVDEICEFTDANNYQPVNLGQLKNVAKPFYDRLAEISFNWRTGTFGVASPPYPWTVTVGSENAAPANLGQLKNVFSFEIPTSFLTYSGDGDALCDWWECSRFGHTAASSSDDPDGDGLTNSQEQTLGTNPLSGDTDADGRTDPNEGTFLTNPIIPDHPDVQLVVYAFHNY